MENKYLNPTENMLTLEQLQKIKILRIYDYINDKKDEIKNNNYSITPILRSFSISKYEINSYLKNVCDLSQKLETGHVCEVLNNIKDRLVAEAKTKKPSLSDIGYKSLVNDDRFSMIEIDKNSENIENKEEATIEAPLQNKTPEINYDELYDTESENIPTDDDKVDTIVMVEDYNKSSVKNANEGLESFTNGAVVKEDKVIPFATQDNLVVIGDSDIPVISEEELRQARAKEIVTNDVDFVEENIVNMSEEITAPKKSSSKFFVIGGGAILIALSLAGTFMFVTSGSNKGAVINNPTMLEPNNTPQQTVNSVNELSALAKNNSAISPISPIEPTQNTQTVETKELTQDSVAPNISTPTIPNIEPVSSEPVSSEKEERLDKIENQLNALIVALNNNKTAQVKTTPVEPTKSTQAVEIKEEVNEVSANFENIASILAVMKNFKFKGASFEYGGKIYKEGDVLGNIRIDTFIPKGYIEFRDLSTQNSKAVKLK